MLDIMIDLETLGTKPGSVILSIGAVAFDRQELGERYHTIIDQQSSKDAGLTVDQSTVDWWGRQGPEARKLLAAHGMPLGDVLLGFHAWLALQGNLKNIRIWGNGSDFDNVLLICAYEAAGLPVPWKFYNHRCYRTLKNITTDLGINIPLVRTGVYHCAVDDAASQADHAIRLLRELKRSV